MSRVMLYIACSLDGYIATPDGGVGWLDDYADGLADFDTFMSGIGAVAMGRATYDFSEANPPWRLGSMPTGVLTHRPIAAPPDGVFAFEGPITGLVTRLSDETTKDIWLMGGGQVIGEFLDADAIDDFCIYIVPIMLGDGVPLFPRRNISARTLEFVSTKTFPSGLLETRFRRPLS